MLRELAVNVTQCQYECMANVKYRILKQRLGDADSKAAQIGLVSTESKADKMVRALRDVSRKNATMSSPELYYYWYEQTTHADGTAAAIAADKATSKLTKHTLSCDCTECCLIRTEEYRARSGK